MGPRTSSILAPGFRFHPTDEELVRYYLKRKIFGLPLLKEARDAITDIDIYKTEPWELPGFSKLDSRDLEWYFFSGLDKKYGNGDRTNRATEQGYWKTTGKDRPVYYRCQVVGMKKTLVYHKGRAPKGQRTNWVMHEYRYVDENNEKAGSVQDAFVVCRVFQKSGSGPKNGEQYGAPFIEEEWEENGLEIVPELEASGQLEASGGDDFLDENDIEQIFNSGIPTDNTPIPLDYDDVENVTSTDSNSNSQNVSIRGGEYNSLTKQSDDQRFCNLPGHYEVAVGAGEYRYVSEQSEDQKSYGLPSECGIYGNYVKNEYIAEPTQTVDPVDDLKFDESLMNAVDNPDFGHGGFLEADDLNYPVDALCGVMPEFGDFDPYFDAIDPFDNLDMLINDESPVSGESYLSDKDFNNGSKPAVISDQQLRGNNNIDDSSSSKLKSTNDFTSDLQYPFLEQASRMLGSISAPPAFASEFPSKDAALRLYPSSSGTAHVTAGMIEIQDVGTQGTDWLSGKLGRYNIVLSFGMSRGVDNSTTLESVVRIRPGKTASGGARSWFYLICICVLILSMSVKIGTRVCAM